MVQSVVMQNDRRTLWASIAIVTGGALWGVIWIPLRAIGNHGLEIAWPGVAVFAAAVVLLLPVAAWRWRIIASQLGRIALCGVLLGGAFSLYATSLFLTEVVRAILLFYLAPVWGTILGVVFLGERLTLFRIAALVLGLAGLLVVLSGEGTLPWPRDLGDWLALGAGVFWALGSLAIYRSPGIALPEQVLAFMVGSLLVTLACVAIGGPTMGITPTPAQVGAAFPMILLTAFFVLPMLILTVWPAKVLTPGRVSLLLMSDVITAVASAAALSGEPFGLREGAGTLLIVGAALVEVIGPRFRKP